MKENNIEEDIKIIEDFILKTDVDYSEYNEQIVGDISYQAIQHILSDYKRVLKENKDLKADNYELNNRITDLLENIPIQKVKDKIEELKKKVEELTDDKGYWGGSDLLEQIKVLQQLLEKEK